MLGGAAGYGVIFRGCLPFSGELSRDAHALCVPDRYVDGREVIDLKERLSTVAVSESPFSDDRALCSGGLLCRTTGDGVEEAMLDTEGTLRLSAGRCP